MHSLGVIQGMNNRAVNVANVRLFKVGDRVQVRDLTNVGPFAGDEGVITLDDGDETLNYRVEFDGGSPVAYFSHNELTFVKTLEQEALEAEGRDHLCDCGNRIEHNEVWCEYCVPHEHDVAERAHDFTANMLCRECGLLAQDCCEAVTNCPSQGQ